MDSVKQLLENEELLRGLVDSKTPEELMKVLGENKITLEEGLTAEEAFSIVKSHENDELNDELNDESLELVSGGVIGTGIAFLAASGFIFSGLALSFLGGYAYRKVESFINKKKRK